MRIFYQHGAKGFPVFYFGSYSMYTKNAKYMTIVIDRKWEER